MERSWISGLHKFANYCHLSHSCSLGLFPINFFRIFSSIYTRVGDTIMHCTFKKVSVDNWTPLFKAFTYPIKLKQKDWFILMSVWLLFCLESCNVCICWWRCFVVILLSKASILWLNSRVGSLVQLVIYSRNQTLEPYQSLIIIKSSWKNMLF